MAGLLSGRVVMDEAWVGGAPRNRHGGTRPGRGGQGTTDKTPVVAHDACHTLTVAEVAGRVALVELGQVSVEMLAADRVVGAVD